MRVLRTYLDVHSKIVENIGDCSKVTGALYPLNVAGLVQEKALAARNTDEVPLGRFATVSNREKIERSRDQDICKKLIPQSFFKSGLVAQAHLVSSWIWHWMSKGTVLPAFGIYFPEKAWLFAAVFYSVFFSVSLHSTHAEDGIRYIDSIVSMNIQEISIRWRQLQSRQQDIPIYASNDPNKIQAFKRALSDIRRRSKVNFWTYVMEKSLAVIEVRGESSKARTIDVTGSGFFVGGQRRLTSMFYSASLAAFLQRVISHSAKRDRLNVPPELFRTLSGGDSPEGVGRDVP